MTVPEKDFSELPKLLTAGQIGVIVNNLLN